jgi:hypothetical protein
VIPHPSPRVCVRGWIVTTGATRRSYITGALLSACWRKSHFRFVFVPSFVYPGAVPSSSSYSSCFCLILPPPPHTSYNPLWWRQKSLVPVPGAMSCFSYTNARSTTSCPGWEKEWRQRVFCADSCHFLVILLRKHYSCHMPSLSFETAGIFCRLAAIVSTTAMSHQYWDQHE